MTTRDIHWNIKGKDVAVHIEETKGAGSFRIDDRVISFRLLHKNTLEIEGRHLRFYAIREGSGHTVWINGRIYQLSRMGKSSSAEAAAGPAGGEITALMPGKLLRVEVAVGDRVAEKQTVAIMESMKMETALYAPQAGRITEIRCQPGEVVDMGEVIMIIDA